MKMPWGSLDGEGDVVAGDEAAAAIPATVPTTAAPSEAATPASVHITYGPANRPVFDPLGMVNALADRDRTRQQKKQLEKAHATDIAAGGTVAASSMQAATTPKKRRE